ncbi:MAG: CapA family protein [Pseudomonadota bacterium]
MGHHTDASLQPNTPSRVANTVSLCLTGDVMTGRGIDQIMPHPCPPEIHEPAMDSALGYVRLAERVSGPLPRAVRPEYIWGDAIAVLERIRPDLRIINLETAVTTAEDWEPKGINYRMHPANLPCLAAAGIDCCVLANNHVLDWGLAGLEETLASLHRAGLKTAGAGHDAREAAAPAILPLAQGGCVLVFAWGAESSGVPARWAAGAMHAGVNQLPDLSDGTVQNIARQIERVKQPGDLVIASLHWGGNWGYRIPEVHHEFAHLLIDVAGVDIIHGHSSHHPIGLEVYRGKLILYGCGDLLNDYEGIGGYESFRGDLSLLYIARLDQANGCLAELSMIPFRIRRFQLQRATGEDADWLHEVLARESLIPGYAFECTQDNILRLTRLLPQGS